jgi:hypothetical protein
LIIPIDLKPLKATMPTTTPTIFDQISAEKTKVSERLARLDAERAMVATQLTDLETAERVVTRVNRTPPARRPTSAAAGARAPSATPGRGRPGTTTTHAAGGKRGLSTLNDQVLALATGKTQQEIAAACKGARPNHVGAAIARHKRAGRIEERDGKLYAIWSAGTEQRAVV